MKKNKVEPSTILSVFLIFAIIVSMITLYLLTTTSKSDKYFGDYNKKITDNLNKQIATKLYEELEKGNSNINSILDNLSDEEQNHITAILADDYEINNIEKAIDDIMQSYEKDKLNERKFQILEMLETPIEENQKKELEKELSEIIIHLAKIK